MFCNSKQSFGDFLAMSKSSRNLFRDVAIDILDKENKSDSTIRECEKIVKYSSIRTSRYDVSDSSLFMFPKSRIIHPVLYGKSLSEIYFDLYTTEHALYEYPKSYQLIQQLEFLIKELRKRPRLTLDLFCGSGIDLLGLATLSDSVIGVDIEKHSVALARINAKRFSSISNITILCEDALKINDKIDVIPDLIYLDCPWGGVDYKKFRDIPLYIGEKELAEFCDELMIKYPNSKLFVKFPRNYQFYRVEHIPFRFQTIYKRDGIEVSYYVGIILTLENTVLRKASKGTCPLC